MATTETSVKYRLATADVRAINRVRSLLADKFSAYPETADDGRVWAIARLTAESLFDLLNWCASYGDMDIADDLLHNRA